MDDLSNADIIQFPQDNVFSIVGEIKWSEYCRSVNVRGYQKTLREGKVIHKSNKAINITVWGSKLINSISEFQTYLCCHLFLERPRTVVNYHKNNCKKSRKD